MKRFAIPFVALIAVCAFAAEVLSPEAVLKDAEKYDGKVVTVKGTLINFKQKTSKKGNDYFTFKLETKDKKNPLSVFSQGKLEPVPKDKAKVEVKGKFAREKKVGDLTFKNEIDVSGKEKEDKPGVKILEDGKQ